MAFGKRNDWLHVLNRVAQSILDRMYAFAIGYYDYCSRRPSHQFYEYVGAMVAHSIDLHKEWIKRDYPAIRILFLSIRTGLQVVCGTSRLAIDLLFAKISMFCHAALIVIALAPIDVPRRIVIHGTQMVLRQLHQATGSVDKFSREGDHALLTLSPTAHIATWSTGAELMFGLSAEQAIGRHAIGSFVPDRDSNGCALSELLFKICQTPEQYALNINENQNQKGDRFWVFWINLPQYDEADILKETICLGIKIDDPAFIQVLINAWKFWQAYFLPPYPRPIASPVE